MMEDFVGFDCVVIVICMNPMILDILEIVVDWGYMIEFVVFYGCGR